MLLPVKWLHDYVELNASSRELADGITDTGSHVEQIIDRDKEINGIITGQITKVEKHPNADKLLVCDVDMGDEKIVIVTGAKNVFEGAIVPVATIGSKLADGTKIGLSEFRGIESAGMFCSLQELGFDVSVIPREVRDGIYIFDEGTSIGKEATVLLDMDWDIIECEITPNRPDCLSIIGMARETAATFNTKLKNNEIVISKEEDEIRDYLKDVSVESPNCRRYYARVLKDVEIKQSPQWLKNNLMAAGVRPINNIVDLTNYVMLEYGQPLHAFDLNDLAKHEIKVYQAPEGLEFQTLDSQVRKLTSEDLVIADGERPIGIAGVMGGMNSEIKNDTKTIVLEGANFNRSAIRHTSKRLNLRTEASTRFEKGLDPEFASIAVDRVCELALEIGAAKVVAGNIDVYHGKKEPIKVTLRPERSNMLLGIDLSVEQMIDYLGRLEISATLKDGVLECTVPTFRGDITIEADLIEEIGRLYGLNNIVGTPIESAMTRGGKPYFRGVQKEVKTALKGMGYNELMTYSFMSPRALDKLMLTTDDPRRDYVKILNPLGEEFSMMRTTLMANILDVISRNQNKGIAEMLCYEIGNTFIPNVEGELPNEELKLIMGLYGDGDFYYLKESLEIALKSVGIHNLTFERETENTLYHGGRCANVYANGEYIGTMGEIHPLVMENYEIKKRTITGEFNFNKIVELSNDDIKYNALPKYPSSSRDLAILLDEGVMMSEVKKIAEDKSDELLESFEVFDIYTGNQIEEGKKSVAFNLVFRSYEKTLKDEEVNAIVKEIVEALSSELGAILRS